jgi:hypothetical protein
MHTLQTAGLPPRTGSRIFPVQGCTRKRSEADRKIARVKSLCQGKREKAEGKKDPFSLLPSFLFP